MVKKKKQNNKIPHRAAWTPLKIGGDLRYSWRVSSSCSTSGIRYPQFFCTGRIMLPLGIAFFFFFWRKEKPLGHSKHVVFCMSWRPGFSDWGNHMSLSKFSPKVHMDHSLLSVCHENIHHCYTFIFFYYKGSISWTTRPSKTLVLMKTMKTPRGRIIKFHKIKSGNIKAYIECKQRK
jgi:hypothetical protein